jgi:putative SOS response-associated peptidase YedK
MCYAYKPVKDTAGKIWKAPHREFQRMIRDGQIQERTDGYHYAKDTVEVLLIQDGESVTAPMRWDLIPGSFMREHPEMTLAEVVKKKNSRAKNPDTMKPWGFDSYNARLESIGTRFSFKFPWKQGKRCVVPALGFKERPNMDEAPPEFKGKEYRVELDGTYFLAGIWDTWKRGAERLDSMAIVTLGSAGNSKLESIWHERCPVILTADQVSEWVDPDTTPERAKQMCLLAPEDRMTLSEVKRPA